MSYAGCCDRCGNLFNVGYYSGSTYVSNGTNLNKKKASGFMSCMYC